MVQQLVMETNRIIFKPVDSNTWSDVYFVNISKQDVEKYSKVVFYSSTNGGTWL